jgi:transcriptional regulator with PAS, ATPase and Fis domain
MSAPLIGISKDIQKIKELIKRVAPAELNIIITGESGVGKEVVAEALYRQSPRSKKPFVKINCAALPETLLESELFGYTRGAFTGAVKRKKGKFELAHQGVLLLDELGDMPFSLQAKLLRVLQTGEVAPLGSEKEIKVDTWIIATTNQDLKDQIATQRFREDLYYRLNTINIHIPPLRERPEDIPLLIEYYTRQYALKYATKEKLDAATISELAAYSWPGNVRELQNVLQRILVVGDCENIVECLKDPGKARAAKTSSAGNSNVHSLFIKNMNSLINTSVTGTNCRPLKEIRRKALDMVEREVISAVLEQTKWNRVHATKILQISYKTLLYKIEGLNLSPPRRYRQDGSTTDFSKEDAGMRRGIRAAHNPESRADALVL